MSHYAIGVIIPKEELETAEGRVHLMMEPFNESIEVDPYIYMNKDDIRKEFEEYKKTINKEKIDNYIKDSTFNDILKYIDKDDSDSAFEIWKNWYYGKRNFDVNGNMLSTYNPNSKWDWYVIGGRWDGIFHDSEPLDQENITTVSAHIDNIKKNPAHMLYGLLDVDGEWHENAVMGWWGLHGEVQEGWNQNYLDILNKAPEGSYIIVVDCHI